MEDEYVDDIYYHWKTMDELKEDLDKYHEFLRTANLPDMDYNAVYLRKLQVIKAYYKAHWPFLVKQNKERPNYMYRPYAFDWIRIFTPIEFSAWQSLRMRGSMPLYPQFPVETFIIDFADPFLKIGLELDGKAYHDKDRDTIRDKILRSKGWTIYRVTGSEMESLKYEDWGNYTFFTNYNDEEDIEEEDYEKLRHWILNTGDGVIEAIKELHYKDDVPNDTRLNNQFRQLCKQSLYNHRLV